MVGRAFAYAVRRLSGRVVPLVLIVAAGQTAAQYWELERIDSVRRVRTVQIARAPSGRLYVCYDTTDASFQHALTRLAYRDSAGWHAEDVFHGRLGGGQPCFAIGPHGEMCVACCDSDGRSWLAERSDTGWASYRFPFTYTENVSVAHDTAGGLHCGFIPGTSDYWVAERVDTLWSFTALYHAFATGEFIFQNHCFRFTPDNRAWYLGANYWRFSSRVWGSNMALLRCTGADWDTLWQDYNVGYDAVAMATHGDTIGFCRHPGPHGDYLHCDDEVVDRIGYFQVAGMACDSAGVPHLAYLDESGSRSVKYAFRTNRWHIDTVPGSHLAVCTDLALDDQGQPLVVFGTPDSGVWLTHGVGVVGVAEPETPTRTGRDMRLSVRPNPCRGFTEVTFAGPADRDGSLTLLDVSGRVVRVRPFERGSHSIRLDLRGVPAGVYFLSSGDGRSGKHVRIIRVE